VGVIPRLNVQERLHLHAERLLDPQRHFRRQRRVAVDEVGQGGTPHVEHLRRLAHRQAEFVENFLADERAWMRRGHC
jgi:hypothetical protein